MRASHLLLAALLVACRGGGNAGAGAPTADPGANPGPSDPCEVRHVADGDTLTCADGRRVRLIGIDSPERSQGAAFTAARAALLRLAPVGGTVRLERDVSATDRYGRALAWVWSGDRLVNELLVEQGWAVLYTVPPDVRYLDRITAAQRRARAASAGLWAANGFDCLPRDRRRGAC